MRRGRFQSGITSDGSRTLGALEKRHDYGVSRKLAQEDTKVALQKATDMKQQAAKTETGKPFLGVEIHPTKQGMQSQTYS